MKDHLFSDRIFCRKLFQLTAPIALQSLMLASVAAADAIMLGSVEQNSMSAVSLATQIQFIQNMICSVRHCLHCRNSRGTVLGKRRPTDR